MSLLINRELITIKVESVYRTDSTPAVGANEVKVENFSTNPSEGSVIIEPAPVQAGFVPDPHTVAGQLIGFTFDVELKGAAAAGTAPEYGALMQACAWSETVVSVTSVTYKPSSTTITSVTIWWYADGTLYKATGCRGNVTFAANSSERMMLSFTMTGHLSGDPTDVALASPTFSAIVAQPFQNAAFTIDGYSAIISSLEFDGGGNVVTPKDINQTNGYGEIQHIAPRAITGSFDPEHVVVATEAFIANMRASKSMALSVGPIGATAGNIINIDMPVVRYREVAFADRDSLRTLEAPFQAYDSAGDDAIAIAHT